LILMPLLYLLQVRAAWCSKAILTPSRLYILMLVNRCLSKWSLQLWGTLCSNNSSNFKTLWWTPWEWGCSKIWYISSSKWPITILSWLSRW
jgi:hypothetical protein